MKVKELIKRLKLCNLNNDISFYFLKDYHLKNCEYETLLNDDRVELTIKESGTDEGGCINESR